jgi:hypothetical protein
VCFCRLVAIAPGFKEFATMLSPDHCSVASTASKIAAVLDCSYAVHGS